MTLTDKDRSMLAKLQEVCNARAKLGATVLQLSPSRESDAAVRARLARLVAMGYASKERWLGRPFWSVTEAGRLTLLSPGETD